MKYFLGSLFLIFIWIFFGGFILQKRSSIIFLSDNILRWPSYFFSNLFSPALNESEIRKIILENEALKAKIWRLKINDFDQSKISSSTNFIGAKIFALSPTNNEIIIEINKGESKGVKKNMVATVFGEIFLGTILNADKEVSSVKSIFTKDWQIPVKIGTSSISGLLIGGKELRVQIVSTDKEVKKDQDIYLASKDLPFGIKIGKVGKFLESQSQGVFKEVLVELPYKISDLVELWLIK